MPTAKIRMTFLLKRQRLTEWPDETDCSLATCAVQNWTLHYIRMSWCKQVFPLSRVRALSKSMGLVGRSEVMPSHLTRCRLMGEEVRADCWRKYRDYTQYKKAPTLR